MHRSDLLPSVSLGATSLVLSMIAVVLVPLPVLSIPIATCAFVVAAVGILIAHWHEREPLRWSLIGMAFSLLVLMVGFAINYAPRGEHPLPVVPSMWEQPTAAPFVAPPARGI